MLHRMLYNLLFAWMSATSCLGQVAPLPKSSAPSDAASEPQAVFKRLQDYLDSNPLDFQTSFNAHKDTLGDSRGSVHFLIQRPNLLRVEISAGTADKFSYLLISDGRVFTIYDQEKRKYAQVPAPSSSLEALYKFAGLTAAEARVLGFLGVVHDVAAGEIGIQATAAGSGPIGGRQCDHFTVDSSRSFAGAEGLTVRWEVWLESSEVPLPCKTVFSSTRSREMQTNEYSWRSTPVLSPETFAFNPPNGSEKVDRVGDLGLYPLH